MRGVGLIVSIVGLCCFINCVVSDGSDEKYVHPNSSVDRAEPSILFESSDIPTPPELVISQIAKQFFGVQNSSELSKLGANNPIGTKREFWVINQAGQKMDLLEAELYFQSPNVDWYIQDELGPNREKWENIVATFGPMFLQPMLERFGNDVSLDSWKFTVLYADIQGVGGYFRFADHYSKKINPFSNEESIIYINSSVGPVGTAEFLRTLVHELQHLIHYRSDPTEETWVNEGLSGLAELLSGYPLNSWRDYLRDPSVSLINWGPSGSHSSAQYGASSLFFTYLFQSVGGFDSLPALVEIPDDGIHGVNVFLNQLGVEQRFLEVYEDWIIENLTAKIDSGFYVALNDRPLPQNYLKLQQNKYLELEQFSVGYTEVELSHGPVVVEFDGQSTNMVFPGSGFANQWCWWGNSGDSIHSTLTRQVNLKGFTDPTLKFEAWFDIEEDWDYAYVSVSRDNGANWDLISGLNARNHNPFGNSLGPGYSGTSDGWVEEEISLSEYVGSEIILRFHYITDEAVNGHGICVANPRITEIDSLFDSPWLKHEWYGDGFFLQNNHFTQSFVVWVVEFYNDSETLARKIVLDPSNDATFDLGGFSHGVARAVVVVSPVSEYTRLKAHYSIKLLPAHLNYKTSSNDVFPKHH